MSGTIRKIVDDALVIVGEVAGVGVQTYGDDRMFADAIRGFDMMFKKYYWDQFLHWDRLALDGTLGIVTTNDLAGVRDFEDFSSVHRDNEQPQLPVLARKVNPFASFPSGGSVLCYTSLASTDANFFTRRLQFYPKTATGFVNICSRKYPALAPDGTPGDWDWEDDMFLDRQLLAYATAFMTLVGDDLNSGAASVIQNLMEGRYKDITGALAGRPLALSPMANIPRRWSERV